MTKPPKQEPIAQLLAGAVPELTDFERHLKSAKQLGAAARDGDADAVLAARYLEPVAGAGTVQAGLERAARLKQLRLDYARQMEQVCV
eukprot:SAG22_NODE_4869_length_1146_cov_1.781280_2_plen_88_part_00